MASAVSAAPATPADRLSGAHGQHPSASPAGSSAVLAETKLRVPTARADALRRDELVARILAGADRKLTLIDAPPGSGKTSLLIEWHGNPRERRPFAWISLDSADNDPVRFWDGVIAALQTVAPALGAGAQVALHSPGTSVGEQVLPLLVNELDGRGESLLLVLDDYHLVDNEQIHRQVEILLDRLPDAVRLAIATRSDPPLPLERLRARAQLSEIRVNDLRLSSGEAHAFLNDVLGLNLDVTDSSRLHDRTEGWIAGLQLAGLSLQGREDRHEFIASFAGDDRQIVDYLGFEVLDHQPEPIRDFLLQTSILDRLSAPLCAAVTGIDDAAEVLDQLERANLFVVALDSRREWYRYHHLFGELLRHELNQARPEAVPELHRRAAAWYAAEAVIQEAIEHATAAGDVAHAIELITAHWYEFMQRGRTETIAAWIDRLPPATVINEPELCLTKAWIGINTGRLDEVDRWVDAAGRLAAADGGDGNARGNGESPPLDSGVASLRATHRYMDGRVGAAVQAGRHALDLEHGGPASPWRPVGCPVLGLALHWRGEGDDAVAALSEAVRSAKVDANHLATMHASGGLAAIELDRGQIDDALAYASQALALADEHGLGEHWAGSLSLAVQGQVLAQRGRTAAADRSIARAVELAQRGVASVEIAYALLALTELRREQGRREDAQRLRGEARRAVRVCTDPGILSELLAGVERRLALTPRHDRRDDEPEALSDAELAVLRLLRSELSQREIGGELFISVNTVKSHARSIYRKLGVGTRDEAVRRAKQLRLV